MKKNLFKMLLFLLIPFLLYSQGTSNERLLEMKNSFILGLTEKGLEIAAELMSRNEYKDVRGETVFYIAEYHFNNSLLLPEFEQRATNANIAFTYYLTYKNDFPNSQYSQLVENRITTLSSTISQWGFLSNLFDYLHTEANIVKKNILFTNDLFKIENPNPYLVFFESDENPEPIKILERYYDDIIVNHPDFEIYGYYWKIISNLSLFKGVNYFSDGLMEFDVDKIPIFNGNYYNNSPQFLMAKKKIIDWLDYLDNKYPHSPITLDLNLIVAKIFMKKNDDKFDLDTKKHLEFVVQNELDKTHPRYMLAKEFLLNNKFE